MKLGHVLAEHGGRNAYSRTMHECVADSFAALRHMQRFGTYSPALDSLLLHRAQRLVCFKARAMRNISPVSRWKNCWTCAVMWIWPA